MADEQSDQGLDSGKVDQPTQATVSKRIELGPDFDRDFYCTIALNAAPELRTALGIDEVSFRRLALSAWPDPRPAFIYRVLDEVQKAGVCIADWWEKIKDVDPTVNSADHDGRLMAQWVLDEQNFRTRKLTEVLLDLVCFSVTNQPEYYRDYLQLRELDAAVRWLIDQEEFFEFRQRNTEYTADWMAENIISGEAKLDVSKRWYLRKPGSFQAKWKTDGVRFSSFRQRYIRSLGLALPNERAVLGQTYIHVYGSISGDVHFTPQNTGFNPDAVNIGFNRVGLLCYAILIRCQHLLGIVPEGRNAWLRDMHDENKGPAEIVGESKQEKAAVGDFVWARGHICEVVDIKRSKFGYVSYSVRYIQRPPIPEIKTDWYPGSLIRLIATRSAAENRLRHLQGDPNIDEKTRTYFRDIEGDKKKERLDKAVITLWRLLQQLKPSDAGKSDPS